MEVGLILKAKVKSNLGEILENKGLRLKWVAEQIGATQAQLTNWCKNEDGFAKSTPSVLYILRLQKLLNVKIEEMYEENEK
ncbi:transcriptional regulator with XRE-family HTH domain [Neobacillus sp. B4I6]|uniref:helix-turn-helix transcriptional regulator n=1 Tax=Neobacillus sp. B4I6 TaxID=3373925 RepID=UPI003D234B33